MHQASPPAPLQKSGGQIHSYRKSSSRSIVFFLILALFSCKKEAKKEPLYPGSGNGPVTEGTTVALSPGAALGREVFEGKGNCISCHKPGEKTAGPAIAEIAKIYKAKKGNIVSFLEGEGEPLVDPSQYEIMKSNLYLTKTFSSEELKGLEAYIYSFGPK